MEFKHLKLHDFPDLKATTTKEGRRYQVDGAFYPSVTTVIGHSKKKSIMEWRKKVGEEEANRISKRASTRGNKCHKLCELYLLNQSISKYKDDPLSMGLFHQIKPYLDTINNIHALEAPLSSKTLKMAGRVDCIAEYKGKISVIDFKTSTKEKKEEWVENYFIQGSAYCEMYEERFLQPIEQVVILIVTEDGAVQTFIKDKRDYLPLLKTAIKEFNEKNN